MKPRLEILVSQQQKWEEQTWTHKKLRIQNQNNEDQNYCYTL